MYTFQNSRCGEIEGEITVLCNALLQAWCSQNVDIVESTTRWVLKYLVQAVRVIGRKDHTMKIWSIMASHLVHGCYDQSGKIKLVAPSA